MLELSILSFIVGIMISILVYIEGGFTITVHKSIETKERIRNNQRHFVYFLLGSFMFAVLAINVTGISKESGDVLESMGTKKQYEIIELRERCKNLEIMVQDLQNLTDLIITQRKK